MLLLLMRHGIAAARDSFVDEASRPLTPAGIERTRRAAQGLKQWVPRLDALISSPKLRALQTAQLVRDVYQKDAPAVSTWPELAGANFQSLQQKTREFKGKTVLLVGHEPHLSDFTSRLLACGPLQLEWKKAGVCALEIDDSTQIATLLWFLPPRVLRSLTP